MSADQDAGQTAGADERLCDVWHEAGEQQAGKRAGREQKYQVAAAPEPVLHVVAEDPDRQRVEAEVDDAPVEEHRRDEGGPVQVRRGQSVRENQRARRRLGQQDLAGQDHRQEHDEGAGDPRGRARRHDILNRQHADGSVYEDFSRPPGQCGAPRAEA